MIALARHIERAIQLASDAGDAEAQLLRARIDRLIELIAESLGDIDVIELQRDDFEILVGGLVVDPAAQASYRANPVRVAERSQVYARFAGGRRCAFRLPDAA